MPILDRIRRIARANILHLLNQADTPEKEIVARIAELESASVEAKDALAGFAVTYRRLEKNTASLEASRADWQSRAESALCGQDEPAARQALAERLRVEDRLASLQPVLQSRRHTYDELKENLVEIHDQLSLARARLSDLRSRRQAAEAAERMGRQMGTLAGNEPAFARLEDSVLESEARAELDRELRGSPASVAPTTQRDFEHLKLDEALAELKRNLQSERHGA